MSTKIYTAYRCTPSKFERVFLPEFRRRCFNNVAQRIKLLMGQVMQDDLIGFSLEREPQGRFAAVRSKAETASRAITRDVHSCLDCFLNTWLYKGKMYAIPLGESWIFEGCRPRVLGADDYSYWDNTDKPKRITVKEWDARRDTWNNVCLRDWDARRMTHSIVDVKHRVGIYRLEKMVLGDKADK